MIGGAGTIRGARLAVILALLVAPIAATADTIYLTGGRVIHTASTRVANGRVHFSQFGGMVSISLEQVERIVEDANVERATVPTVPALPAMPALPATEMLPPAPATASRETPEGATPSEPWDEAEYWIAHLKEVDERIARVRSELDRLPEYDDVEQRLFRFSGQIIYFVDERQKWDVYLRRLQASRRQLLEDARKAGIPPGALRRGLSG